MRTPTKRNDDDDPAKKNGIVFGMHHSDTPTTTVDGGAFCNYDV